MKGTVQMKAGERIELRKVVSAPPEDVFAAWTEADAVSQWMRPGTTKETRVALDVQVGGKYSIDMVDGERVYAHHGEYLEIDPPRKLVFTWHAEWIPGGSVVTVELHARGNGTEVVLTHEGLPDAESAANHSKGWGEILDRLAESVG